MKKSDVTTGILSQVVISRSIPPRLQRLYFSILGELKYKELDPENQLIADQIAYCYCKIKDVQDMRYLYGMRLDLPRSGEAVNSMAERREKMQELELLPALQKQLITWISALRAGKNKMPGEDPTKTITEELRKYATGYGVENID